MQSILPLSLSLSLSHTHAYTHTHTHTHTHRPDAAVGLSGWNAGEFAYYRMYSFTAEGVLSLQNVFSSLFTTEHSNAFLIDAPVTDIVS